MERLPLPERVFFAREFLNHARQDFEVLPEPSVRSANHGRSWRRPARMSVRISSATELRRPSSEKSLSIWRSQAALSRSRIKAASSVNSTAESASTAFLISARLTGRSLLSPRRERNLRVCASQGEAYGSGSRSKRAGDTPASTGKRNGREFSRRFLSLLSAVID